MDLLLNILNETNKTLQDLEKRIKILENANEYHLDINDKNENIIICLGDEEGFIDTFLRDKQWYYVRVSEKKINKFKYLGVYRMAPTHSITHIATIRDREQCIIEGKMRWKFYLKDIIELKNSVKLGNNRFKGRGVRYLSPHKFLRSNTMDDF